MTKDFNILLSANDIVHCYKENDFPNAYCLLWNKEQLVDLITTQRNKVVATQREKGVAKDGITEFPVY